MVAIAAAVATIGTLLSIAKITAEVTVTIFLRFVRCKIMLHSCLTFQHCSHAFRPLPQSKAWIH